MAEQGADGSGDTEPVSEHPRHLAERGEVVLEDPGDPGQAAGELPGPHDGRAAGRSHRADEPGRHLRPRPEPVRCGVRRECVVGAEEVRGDVGVGGAPDVEQLARVVGLACGLGVDTQAVGQPHGEQRAVQAVLQRYADAEVGRQGQRRDDLRGADTLAGRRRIVGHIATLLAVASRRLARSQHPGAGGDPRPFGVRSRVHREARGLTERDTSTCLSLS